MKMFTMLSIALLLIFPSILPKTVSADQGQYYEKQFAWDYDGNHWKWNLTIPKNLHNAYQEVPVSVRTQKGPAGYGFLTTTNDYYMRMLAEKLNQTTNQLGYDEFNQVSFILAFVQSLEYTSDNVTTGYDEYPRFPIETLVADGGDCEDSAVLFATLTLILGYGTVYINPPNHYAVGILGDNLPGTYFTYNGLTYYYCETTGNGFKIGQLPIEFSGMSAHIYAIDESQQFVPKISDVVSTPTPLSIPGYKSAPIPTPTPTDSSPTIQPVLPLSFNLIMESPVLFAVIIVAIGLCIAATVKSVRKPKRAPIEGFKSTADLDGGFEEQKFCIHCGSSNKLYASYCEKCGNQID